MVLFKPELRTEIIPALRRNVISGLGYPGADEPDRNILKTIDRLLPEIIESARPRAAYVSTPIISSDKSGILTEFGVIRSHMFYSLSSHCSGDRAVVFMIVTAGEEWKEVLTSGDSVYMQFLSDTIGSEMAELLADMVEERLRKENENKGLKMSMRFSPGYCDWDLKGQEIIFRALDAERIGVRLTSHSVMMPEKTISAVALTAEAMPAAAPCVFCAKDCDFRRLPYSQSLD